MTQANVGIQGTKYQKRSNLSTCASKSESQKPQLYISEVRTVSSQCLLFTLLMQFQLIYGQSNMNFMQDSFLYHQRLRKMNQKWCSQKNFRPFLFCDGFSQRKTKTCLRPPTRQIEMIFWTRFFFLFTLFYSKRSNLLFFFIIERSINPHQVCQPFFNFCFKFSCCSTFFSCEQSMTNPRISLL